jgi:hypothetical protein
MLWFVVDDSNGCPYSSFAMKGSVTTSVARAYRGVDDGASRRSSFSTREHWRSAGCDRTASSDAEQTPRPLRS